MKNMIQKSKINDRRYFILQLKKLYNLISYINDLYKLKDIFKPDQPTFYEDLTILSLDGHAV